jgi:hypothetical protein
VKAITTMLRVGTAMFTVRASLLVKLKTSVTKHTRVVSFHVAIMNSMLLL